MAIDMNNRWVYKGSLTTPPCDSFVYWNVAKQILPIKQRHLDMFKNYLKNNGHPETNYRVTQTIN